MHELHFRCTAGSGSSSADLHVTIGMSYIVDALLGLVLVQLIYMLL